MKVKFWGVCGSVPAPLTNEKFRRKISSIIQRITPADLESAETREKFLAGLPQYLFSVIGGNTTCIEIRLSSNTVIIIDAGTGIRELGRYMEDKKEGISRYHIFFTHFHWDHIQGIPFFAPVYDPDCEITFYSPLKGFSGYLGNQMIFPYFPIKMSDFNAKINFVELDGPLDIGGAEISYRSVLHPGGCFSYKFTEKGKSLIISTDTELKGKDFIKNDESEAFYQNADMIILDAQYTLDEAIEKYNWGHSSYSLGVDFVGAWKIKNFVLFHHNPDYDEKKIFNIKNIAECYSKQIDNFDSNIILAREGLVLEV